MERAATSSVRVNTASSSRKIAPSYRFLYGTGMPASVAIADKGTAFIGAATGFIAPTGLDSLPPPYSAWREAVQQLPATCKTDSWASFVASIPHISAEHLPDCHLLRANAYLGAIAHALHNIAAVPIPDTILSPWSDIGKRLSRPTPSLTTLDYILYNFDIVEPRIGDSSDAAPEKSHHRSSVAEITDPWAQTKPHFTVTGSMIETHALTGFFSVELAARRLPGVIASAQQAVLDRDTKALRNALVEIIKVIEGMASAFMSSDPRPLSARYVDHVEFGRSVGVLALAVLPGEKTASGFLFPSMHLLDIFFEREKYNSEFGVLEKSDRTWLPLLHKQFFQAVSETSVHDFISNLSAKESRGELLAIFRRAYCAFADESGFLGKHRIRVNGFMELSIKVGRPATAAGTETEAWQSRPWETLNENFKKSMDERLRKFQERFVQAKVKSCSPVHPQRNSAHRVVIDTNGAMVYSPGDHLAVLPENEEHLVQETIDILELGPSSAITLRSPNWIQAFMDRGMHINECAEGESLTVTAKQFFSAASLAPLDHELGCRLAEGMFATNPAVLSFLKEERATSVPIVLGMLKETSPMSPAYLVKVGLENIFQPLAPRYYSVSSNFRATPTSVEIVVGKVQYALCHKLSFQYGTPPWKRKSALDQSLPIQASEGHLAKYASKSPTPTITKSRVSNAGRAMVSEEAKHSLQYVCSILARKTFNSTGYATRKATCRAEIINLAAKSSHVEEETMDGIASGYLSRLKTGDLVRAKIVPEIDFHMPKQSDAPVIMVALGSGVAAFKSFLLELIHEKRTLGSSYSRSAWLILGVQEIDLIPFIEELEEAVCKEKICDISIAVSREDAELDSSQLPHKLSFRPGLRKHVTDLFDEVDVAMRFWKLISTGAHVYACGRPELEPLVRGIIASVVKRFTPMLWRMTCFDVNNNLESLAEEYADRMAADRKLHFDAYYSGKASPSTKSFSHSEVAGHGGASSCWVIFGAYVYDLTTYLSVHPGGPKTLLDKAGRDMTTDFDIAHGADNYRVKSMVDPYRIGFLDTFPKSSQRIRGFMDAWSIPLLHGVLEHRSVFLLTLNEFPELREPTSFVEWKSNTWSPANAQGLCRKFFMQHEPELFDFLEQCCAPGKLGRLLIPLTSSIGIHLDSQILVEEIRVIRKARISSLQPTSFVADDVPAFLNGCKVFVNKFTSIFISLQRDIERALRQTQQQMPYRDVVLVMLSSVFDCITNGISDAYELLPGT